MPDGPVLSHTIERSSDIVTLPNIISFCRLCAVPVAVWLVVRHEMQPAFWLFLAAGLSDAVDGWLARRGRGSALGAVLDPLADKALLTTMYVALAAIGLLPDWLAILVVFRDVVIVGGVVLMSVLGHSVVIAPIWPSKLNTAGQIALVAGVLLMSGFHLAAPNLSQYAIWFVAATTLVSGALYVRNATRSV